jgi:hypothetical protein
MTGIQSSRSPVVSLWREREAFASSWCCASQPLIVTGFSALRAGGCMIRRYVAWRNRHPSGHYLQTIVERGSHSLIRRYTVPEDTAAAGWSESA